MFSQMSSMFLVALCGERGFVGAEVGGEEGRKSEGVAVSSSSLVVGRWERVERGLTAMYEPMAARRRCEGQPSEVMRAMNSERDAQPVQSRMKTTGCVARRVVVGAGRGTWHQGRSTGGERGGRGGEEHRVSELGISPSSPQARL